MKAGSSEKARVAPVKEKFPEMPTVPPIESRRTLPFIRATPAEGAPDSVSDSFFDFPDGSTEPSPPPITDRRASQHPSDGPPEDNAPTDPAPARGSSSPGFVPDVSLPPPSPYHLPSPSPPRPSFPHAGEDVTRPVALAAELAGKGPTEVEPLIHELLGYGPAGLDAITRQFPGFLWFDRSAVRGRPPRAPHVSAAAAILFRAGEAAIPHLIHLLGASDRNVRFCAALVVRELNDPSVVQPLFRMLVDVDPDNVDAAMLAISGLREEWVEPRLAQLRESLQNAAASPGQHLMAARTLGALRDVRAVPLLVERVNLKHADVADAVLAALVTLTCHDFKKSRSKWRRWLKRNGAKERIEWLLEGLTQADASLRVRAFRELVLVTGEELGVHRTANKEDTLSLRDEYHAIALRQSLLRG